MKNGYKNNVVPVKVKILPCMDSLLRLWGWHVHVWFQDDIQDLFKQTDLVQEYDLYPKQAEIGYVRYDARKKNTIVRYCFDVGVGEKYARAFKKKIQSQILTLKKNNYKTK